jgi:hypothetical protein
MAIAITRAIIATITIAAITTGTDLAAAQPAAKVFELLLVKGRVTGEETLRVKRGERVELRWKSDRPIELHLHGYDLEAKAAPQAPATMAFDAKIAGRFPVTEHTHGPGHHRAIVYLEVHP